ncbi:MAG: hypothetical protein FWD05_05150 [Oscillospiraceae bacterium]|nr:hypothetical protein [Oscillospiraceae bacterium]
MKKRLLILLAFLFLSGILVACENGYSTINRVEDKNVLTAVILHIGDEHVVVEVAEDDDIWRTNARVSFRRSELYDIDAVIGDTVLVTYTDFTDDTYPGWIEAIDWTLYNYYQYSEAIEDAPIPPIYIGSVIVFSDGDERRAVVNWHHGFDPEISASGQAKLPEEVADRLSTFSFEDDFQIIIEGTFAGNPSYYFHKLTDGEWNLVLAVYSRDGFEQVFVTQGLSRDEWELVNVDSFLDLLEPGEYILDVDLWWSNSMAGSAYQNFFRFIK